MEEVGIQLQEEPLFWDTSKAERWHAEQQQQQQATTAVPPSSSGTSSTVQVKPMRGVGTGGGHSSSTRAGGNNILISCSGHTVPWDFSLAAVRQWIWRRSDDLVLHYSIRDLTAPLKLPAIRFSPA